MELLHDAWAVVGAKWGTVLVVVLTGTVLANLKTALEIYDRFVLPKVAIERQLNGLGGDLPNYVYVTNLSEKALILSYWELVWREPWWKFWCWGNRDTLIADSGASKGLKLDPLVQKTFIFGGEHWFDWGSTVAKGRHMVFRHWMTGERRCRLAKL